MNSRAVTLASLLILFMLADAFAQPNLPQLRTSPRAKAEQNIGFANLVSNMAVPALRAGKSGEN